MVTPFFPRLTSGEAFAIDVVMVLDLTSVSLVAAGTTGALGAAIQPQ
jgi:hypothetical protein